MCESLCDRRISYGDNGIDIHQAATMKGNGKASTASTEKIISSDELDPEEAQSGKREGAKLKRVFGVLDATAHIVGGIIGSGIFISPKVRRMTDDG
jgi:hypothetical protein